MVITIEMPDSMYVYHKDIQEFVDLMVHKLHKNIHKGRWENQDVWSAFYCLMDETTELRASLQSSNRQEAYLECADVANFAMIVAAIMKERGGNG